MASDWRQEWRQEWRQKARAKPAVESTKRSKSKPTGWHTFTWEPGVYTGMMIESILNQYGIEADARHAATGDGMAVRAAQAEWAEYNLCAAGVPLTSELIDPAHAEVMQRRAGSMPVPRGDGVSKPGVKTQLWRMLDNVLAFGANQRGAREFVKTRERSTKRKSRP